MDISFLYDYMTPVIVGICLCVGYILKNIVTSDKINKYIPLLMGTLGLVLSLWMGNWAITPAAILNGLFSGLASTGLYEVFSNLIGKDK